MPWPPRSATIRRAGWTRPGPSIIASCAARRATPTRFTCWASWKARAAGRARPCRCCAVPWHCCPATPDFLGNLARTLRAAGQPDAAERAFARTAALDPADAQIAFTLGALRLERGDAAGAAAAFAQALVRRPDFVEARINGANALAALGRAEDAARLRRQAVALAPAHPDALHNAAVSALADAGLDRPLSHARRLDPDLVERAGRVLVRALAADPRHGVAADALLGTVLSLVQAGQVPECLLDRAARYRPDGSA
ncbi:protein of unknown function, partial (plasmid) [Azospirillum baldaniorum]